MLKDRSKRLLTRGFTGQLPLLALLLVGCVSPTWEGEEDDTVEADDGETPNQQADEGDDDESVDTAETEESEPEESEQPDPPEETEETAETDEQGDDTSTEPDPPEETDSENESTETSTEGEASDPETMPAETDETSEETDDEPPVVVPPVEPFPIEPTPNGMELLEYMEWPFDTEEAQRRQAEVAAVLGVPVSTSIDVGGGTMMDLVLIPNGQAELGSPQEERGHEGDETLRMANFPTPFYLTTTQVTRAQYNALMGEFPPNDVNPFVKMSDSLNEPALAAYRVVVDDMVPRVQALLPEGWTVRLQGEDEFEYAARAGTTTVWFSGDTEEDLYEIAWCADNGGGKIHDVGLKAPNPWGLYDVVGNVWHWVFRATGGFGDMDTVHIVRGGDFAQEAFGNGCRTANLQIQETAEGYRFAIDPPLP